MLDILGDGRLLVDCNWEDSCASC